jgi:hypothetical protein
MTGSEQCLTAVKQEVDLATLKTRKVGKKMVHAQTWCLHVGDGCFMAGCLQKRWAYGFDQPGDRIQRDVSLLDKR